MDLRAYGGEVVVCKLYVREPRGVEEGSRGVDLWM